MPSRKWRSASAFISSGVARKSGGRNSISLHPEPGMMTPGPIMQRRDEAIVQQIGDRLPPIMTNRRGFRPDIGHQRRQPGPQIVSSALLELRQEIISPILVVHLQAVAEDRQRRIRTK